MKIIYDSVDNEPPRILNIGCGSDIMENAVNIDTNINSGLAFDYNNCLILEGEIKSPQDFGKKVFNTVYATMVMEHVHPDLIPNMLYCISNFLVDNGALIITVPNFSYIIDRMAYLKARNSWCLDEYFEFRELTNELLCPNMCGMVNHQSVWVKITATTWLEQEGFAIVNWNVSDNKMHVTIKAVKLGGDHASRIKSDC